MIQLDEKLQLVIFLFICSLFILYRSKSRHMFDENNNIKQFGTGKDKTITPIWLVGLVMGLFIYVYLTVQKDDYV